MIVKSTKADDYDPENKIEIKERNFNNMYKLNNWRKENSEQLMDPINLKISNPTLWMHGIA